MKKNKILLSLLTTSFILPSISIVSCSKSDKKDFTYSSLVTFSPNKSLLDENVSLANVEFKWKNAKAGDIVRISIVDFEVVTVLGITKHEIDMGFTSQKSAKRSFQKRTVKHDGGSVISEVSCFYKDTQEPITDIYNIEVIFKVEYVRNNKHIKEFTTDVVTLVTSLPTNENMFDYEENTDGTKTLKSIKVEEWQDWQKYNILSIPSYVSKIDTDAFNIEKLHDKGIKTNFQYIYWETDENGSCAINTIGEGAFYGQWITGILTIPSTVNVIGKNAFANNYYVSGIIFEERSPNAGLEIGESAFENDTLIGSMLPDLILPEGTTLIGKNAFASPAQGTYVDTNIWLEKIVLPQSVTNIGESAFANLQYLLNIDMSKLSSDSIANNSYNFYKTFTGCGTYLKDKGKCILPNESSEEIINKMKTSLQNNAGVNPNDFDFEISKN